MRSYIKWIKFRAYIFVFVSVFWGRLDRSAEVPVPITKSLKNFHYLVHKCIESKMCYSRVVGVVMDDQGLPRASTDKITIIFLSCVMETDLKICLEQIKGRCSGKNTAFSSWKWLIIHENYTCMSFFLGYFVIFAEWKVKPVNCLCFNCRNSNLNIALAYSN